MTGRWRWALAAAGVLLALQLPTAAHAGWLTPVDVSETSEYVSGPQVVLDSAGNATAVWDRWAGTDMVVEAAYRPAGEGWQFPVDLSSVTEEGPGEELAGAHNATSPRIAVDGDGDTTVVWERYAGANRIFLQAAYKPAGEAWQTPVDIGEVKTMWAPEPWIAVDEQGEATAVWTNAGVIESAHRATGGSWGAPVPISDAKSESYTPEAAVNAQGDATAVWMHYDGSRYVVESAYRPVGGSWEAPTLVSAPGEEGGNPHIALGAQGDSTVIWRGESGGEEAARASYRSPEGDWGEPVDVSVPGDQVQFPRVALDAKGNAIAVWASDTHELGGHTVVLAAYRPAGEGWGDPTLVSAEGENAFPSDVAFDTSGNSAVVWSRSNGTNDVLQAAYRPSGGSWEEPIDLSGAGEDATDAVVVLGASGESTAAKGIATAVWISTGSFPCGEKALCSGSRVQAAGYDALDSPAAGLDVPAVAAAGTPVEISVPPANIWAPRMDFGDGTSVASTSATHTYSEPGEYTVSFSSTEVLGYPSSAQRTIVVGPTESSSEPPGPEEEHSPPAEGVASPIDGAQPSSPAPPLPTADCGAAEAARAAALLQLRLAQAKLKHGSIAVAKRLKAQKRKRAAALRRATRLAGEACGAGG
jgi:PKD domain-containing protein